MCTFVCMCMSMLAGSSGKSLVLQAKGAVNQKALRQVEKTRPIDGLEFRRQGKEKTRMSAYISLYPPPSTCVFQSVNEFFYCV